MASSSSTFVVERGTQGKSKGIGGIGFSLFAVHRPKLINSRCEALTHHLPAHTPFWIGRHTGEAHCPPAPPAIDGIQNAHHFLGRFRLGDRKEIFGVLTFLA